MIEVYIDAASKGNPGLSGGGIVIKNNGSVEQFSIPLGTLTNHEAEFATFVHALKICKQNNYEVVSFRTDSKIVNDSVEKQFVKNPEYKPFLQNALELIHSFDLFFIKWIPSSQNKLADQLARQAINKNS